LPDLSTRRKETMMSTEANRQLARRGYDMFMKGDIEGVIGLCADDIDWVSPKTEAISFSGSFHGKAEVGRFFRLMSETIEFERFEPQCFIADGDKVAVSGISRARVLENGARFDDAWVHIFTMKNGKVAHFEQYNNSAASVAALSAPLLSNEDMAGAV
jgi:ketosteroid isomerase-like protein